MILFPCFTGTIGFGQKFLKGAIGKLGDLDAKEILSLIENVCKSKEKINKDRIHVYGGSYGGYMAGIMGTRYPEHFKSAIMANAVISIMGNLWGSDLPEWSTVETLNSEDYHKLTKEDDMKMY
jgi:acylaminoacyl-peptidase